MKARNNKLKILQDAMEIELNGIELYKVAAEKTDDEQAKDFFQFLSKEEEKHFNILKEWYSEIARDKTPKVKIEEVEKPGYKHIFSDEFMKNLKGKNFEYSVLTTGMLLEKNSVEFYHNKGEEAETGEEKELFKTLEKWESKHYQMLLDEYNELKIKFWRESNFSPF